MKRILILIAFVFLLTLSSNLVLAQNETKTENPVNSFEIFWPLVAGRTKGDKFYTLKTFKEKVRGLLIFGKPQKADYSLFLVTKRLLEVEKLSKEGKKDYSLQTLDNALAGLSAVDDSMTDAGEGIKLTIDDLNLKFDNLEIFLPWLINEYKDRDLKDKTQLVLDKVIEFHKKI